MDQVETEIAFVEPFQGRLMDGGMDLRMFYVKTGQRFWVHFTRKDMKKLDGLFERVIKERANVPV